MKNNILAVIILTFAFVLVANVYAANQSDNAGISNQNQEQTQAINQGGNSQIQVQTQQQLQNENGVEEQAQVQEQVQEGIQNQDEIQQLPINAEQHQNTVANFVQTLLDVADKQGELGEQIRTIAQQQNESADTTLQAAEKVQTRSKVRTFLFGSDYKNLGVLRHEMVQTQSRLQQLNNLMDDIQSEEDEVVLQNQIQTLEQEQTKIEEFIETQEGKFSLFGWLKKLF